tara:strand:+ start:633 stop:893 length:261 start_codon:yes stop_codon:yes gene_type:complete
MNKLVQFYNDNVVKGNEINETEDGKEVEVKSSFHSNLITKYDESFCDCNRCQKPKEELEVIVYHSDFDFICFKCFEEVTKEDMKEY